MSSEKYVIFGWPNCGYAQRARRYAEQNDLDYTFVDTSRGAPAFLKQLSTYGSGPGRWQSPHIFRYVGGSEEFSDGGSAALHAGCRRTLDGIICD